MLQNYIILEVFLPPFYGSKHSHGLAAFRSFASLRTTLPVPVQRLTQTGHGGLLARLFALLPLLWKAHAAFSFCRFCSKLACSSAFSSLASPVLVPRHGETAMARPVAGGEAAELAPDIHGLGESRMSRLVHTQCSSIPILARSASVMLFLFAIGQWSGRKGREGGRE